MARPSLSPLKRMLAAPLLAAASILSEKGRKKYLKQIGVLLVAQAQQAFREYKLGSFRWKKRYPPWPSPAMNLAGVVADLLEGGRAKDRRWEDWPPLKDRGILKNSFASATKCIRFPDAWTVEVGTVVPYAGKHQWGGKSTQPITRDVKVKIMGMLAKDKRVRPTDRGRLQRLLTLDELVTDIVQRPFLGITDQLQKDIMEALKTIAEEDMKNFKGAYNVKDFTITRVNEKILKDILEGKPDSGKEEPNAPPPVEPPSAPI